LIIEKENTKENNTKNKYKGI